MVLLGIKLYNYFNLFSIELSWSHDSGYEFCRLAVLTRVNFFYLFFNMFFFQFYLSTMSWLRIKLYNFFRLVFYGVISVSWSESQVLWVICVDSGHFLVHFFNYYFFQIHLSILGWLVIILYNLFWFFFVWSYLSLITWVASFAS